MRQFLIFCSPVCQALHKNFKIVFCCANTPHSVFKAWKDTDDRRCENGIVRNRRFCDRIATPGNWQNPADFSGRRHNIPKRPGFCRVARARRLPSPRCPRPPRWRVRSGLRAARRYALRSQARVRYRPSTRNGSCRHGRTAQRHGPAAPSGCRCRCRAL